MSKNIVTTIPEEAQGVKWPIPDAIVTQKERALRSGKPQIHYQLTEAQLLRGPRASESYVISESEVGAVGEAISGPPRLERIDLYPTPQDLDIDPSAPQQEELDPEPENLDEVFLDAPPGNLNIVLPAQQIIAQPGLEIMAEDRTLLPNPFSGSAEDDAAEFWRRLDTYAEFKGHNEAAKLRLAKATFVQTGRDWLESLPDASKDTFEHLKTAFTERFIQPSILRFKSAKEIFGNKQAIDETVDAYVNRLRKLGKRIEAGDSTLLYALLSGLKPALSSYVVGRNPQSFTEGVDAARIAEISVADVASSPTEQLLSDQLVEMKRELQRLTKQNEQSLSLTVSLSEGDRTRSPVQTRRVTFADNTQQARLRAWMNQGGFRPPQFTGPYRPRFQQGRSGYGQRFNYQSGFGGQIFRPQGPNRYGGSQGFTPLNVPPQRRNQGVRRTPGERCNKCGRAAHENIMFCPALNELCAYCGRPGHFRAVCRAAKRD